MLLTRFKFPSLKKRPHMAKKKTNRYYQANNTRQLPLEIQEVICDMVLADNTTSNAFALTAMTVCKTWAYLICERMYRKCQFKGYLQFIGFVNTLSLPDPLLLYGLYVKNIDLTSVNKYGVDSRMRKMLAYCPNIDVITLGHTTSVKEDTLKIMGRYCASVRTLQMGSIQSFPFMFDCDFSGMHDLRNISLTTTPLQSKSLQTLPRSIRHLQLIQMDALEHEELVTFFQQHPELLTLSIRRCKHITSKFAQLVEVLPRLKELDLCGHEINDLGLNGFFDIPITLHTLRICHTQISDTTLEALTNGSLVVQHLDISNNANITKYGVASLLRKKEFKKFTV